MSEQLMMVGTSFRRVGFERLGRYVLPIDERVGIAALRDACGATEIVYVATCNRVEAWLAFGGPEVIALPARDLAARVADFFARRGADGASPDDLVVLEGAPAIEHLFGVVASLDSLVLGECEIAGQVRRAAEAARAGGLAGPRLGRLFEHAARVARRVRSETAIGRTPVSVASLVLRRIREHFKDLAPRGAALIGVNDVTRKIAQALQGQGFAITFVNRTVARAQELAARYGGMAMSLAAFRAAPPADIDILVAATRAPEPVVDAAMLAPALATRGTGPRILVCDLGIPPDVDAAVDALEGVRVLRLPDLEATARENRERLAGEVLHVQEIVAQEARRVANEARMRALAAESAEALVRKRLAHLSPEDREAVLRFATGLAERLARQPAA